MADGGYGAALQAAVDLTKWVIGTNTTTNTNSNTQTSQNVNATTTVSDNTNTTTNTKQNTTSNTTGTSKTTNSTDPFVIQSMKSLAQQAMDNSNDPSKTQGIITGFIQQAADAMTNIFGQNKQTGTYNNAATTAQTNDLISRASADASQAILNYQTQEQSTASDVLKSLGALTATSQTDTNSTTNTENDTTTNTAVQDTATTNVNSQSNSDQKVQSSSSSHSGMSLICTWMTEHGLMTKKHWMTVTRHYLSLPTTHQKGYLVIAVPMVRHLEASEGKGFISSVIMKLFAARTEYVCATMGLRGAKKSIRGWIARAIVACMVFPPALYYVIESKISKEKAYV